jgi:glutaminyl-peptide cyclotransferase
LRHKQGKTIDPGPTPAVDVELNIDQDRTMQYLRALCRIGPRISGSTGMVRQQEVLQQHFENLGAAVERQVFVAKQRRQPPVEMTNLVVTWHPDRERRVLLCSHYDTRPIADQEPSRADWTRPFVSANDGGSGVALLMELAHHVREIDCRVGVDFALFDGEEYIFNPRTDRYFFGSEHFARTYLEQPPRHRYLGGVLFDMIGGAQASFPVEPNSWFLASELTREIWSIAQEQNCGLFQLYLGQHMVDDDHLALNHAGIPTIDIIDFDYEHWHKLSDVPDNCSAAPMAQVARVVGCWIGRQH